MVAYLFQGCDGRKDQALLLTGVLLAFGGVPNELVEDSLVQSDLLRCHRAMGEFVNPVRKFCCDSWLRLGATEYENSVESVQRRFCGAHRVPDLA